MNALIHQLNDWSAAWAGAMTTFVWQATLLAMLVAAACWALRHQSPALRYGLWLILAAKLLVMPFWTVNVGTPDWLRRTPTVAMPPSDRPHVSTITPPSAEPSLTNEVPPSSVESATPADAPQPTPTLPTWLMVVWGAVVLIEVARTVRQYHGLKSVLSATRPADHDLASLVAECVRQVGLVHPPAVRVIDADGSPLVCGPFRPVLLLPASLLSTTEPCALRQIVLHELSHIRRGDLLSIWILHAARTLYWFHPIVHWMAYRAGLERELACDQSAMIHSGATPAGYARTLISAAGRATHPTVLSAVGAARLDGGFTK